TKMHIRNGEIMWTGCVGTVDLTGHAYSPLGRFKTKQRVATTALKGHHWPPVILTTHAAAAGA
ncbi:MAG: hypothetical protein WCI17_09645, partial [bacterium]